MPYCTVRHGGFITGKYDLVLVWSQAPLPLLEPLLEEEHGGAAGGTTATRPGGSGSGGCSAGAGSVLLAQAGSVLTLTRLKAALSAAGKSSTACRTAVDAVPSLAFWVELHPFVLPSICPPRPLASFLPFGELGIHLLEPLLFSFTFAPPARQGSSSVLLIHPHPPDPAPSRHFISRRSVKFPPFVSHFWTLINQNFRFWASGSGFVVFQFWTCSRKRTHARACIGPQGSRATFPAAACWR